MNGFIFPTAIVAVTILGTALGQPDWTAVAVVASGSYWITWQFARLHKRLDNLPCNDCDLGKNKKGNVA